MGVLHLFGSKQRVCAGPFLQEMHDDLTLFSGILGEALKLNDSGGLFGRSLGGISSTYLVNQEPYLR